MQPRRTLMDEKFGRGKPLTNSEERRSTSNFGRPTRVDSEEMSRMISNTLEKLPASESSRRYSLSTVAFKPNQRVLLDTIATFLREFDGRFDSSGLDCDMLPEVFKIIGFYSPINKNLFNPVGAPHTWNSCLLIMSWLAGLAVYHYEERMLKEKRRHEDRGFEATMEDCILDSFHRDSADLSVVEAMIKKERDSLTAEIQRYVFDKESAELATRNLNDAQPDNSIIRDRVEQLKKQLFRERQENLSIENSIEQKSRAIKDKQREAEDLDNNIAQVDAEIASTEETIRRQELSVSEVSRINIEIAEFQEKQRAQRQKAMSYSDRYAEATNKIHYKFIELQNLLGEFNRILLDQDPILRSRNLEYSLSPLDLNSLVDYLSDCSSRNCDSLERLRNSELDRTNAYCLRLAENIAGERARLAALLKKGQEEDSEVSDNLRRQQALKKDLYSEEVGLQESNRFRQAEVEARRGRLE